MPAEYKKQRKFHEDRKAKPLLPLKERETIRNKSNKGLSRKAIAEWKSNIPRSFLVKTSGRTALESQEELILSVSIIQ